MQILSPVITLKDDDYDDNKLVRHKVYYIKHFAVA